MMNVMKVAMGAEMKTGMVMGAREIGALEKMTGMVSMGIPTVMTGIDMLEIMRDAIAEMFIGTIILAGEVQAWMTIIMVGVEALIDIETVHMTMMGNILLGIVSLYFYVKILNAEY